MKSMNILFDEDYGDFSSLYWIPKLHKNPYRERYTAGASTSSTKKLLIDMDNILSAVKGGLQSYCDKVYSPSSFNQMWILKYCKDLMNSFNFRYLICPKKKNDFSRVQTISLENVSTRLNKSSIST